MAQFTLIWISAAVFCGFVVWGSNVPTEKRTPVIIWVVSLLILFNLLTQSFFFRIEDASYVQAEYRREARTLLMGYTGFLDRIALRPGSLLQLSPGQWYRLISSTFLHYGLLHVLFNAWFFVLFGHVIEHALGGRKLIWIVVAGVVIPSLLDGLFAFHGIRGKPVFTGGFSGPVYAVMGAYLMLFPRSRFYAAINYDLRFWGAIICLLLPVTMVTRLAGMGLTETVLIMGAVAAFLLIQPEHARVSAPAILIVLYKLVQDVLLVQPSIHDVLSNSFCRVAGGFLVGGALALAFEGRRGWAMTWGDETRGKEVKHNTRTRMSLARLEAEGNKSEEGARIFLGQRVFVGDAERSVAFYRDVVLKHYPDLLLPLQEQMALARLLHFKGHDKESLHAYETLIRGNPHLPDEYWETWLRAAELTMRVYPEDTARARHYLDRFEQGHGIKLRDKVEAQRLRALLPIVETEPSAQPSYEIQLQPEELPAETGQEGDAEHGFVKLRPRTFLYVPGSAPVNLVKRQAREDLSTLADANFLQQHWKPLPSLAEKNPAMASLLDRRITNPRHADQPDVDSMYAANLNEAARHRKFRGRLSQLELRAISSETKADIKEMPGGYGGLADYSYERDQIRIRLRGEKDSGDNVRNPIHRRQVQSMAKHWESPLEPLLQDDANLPEAVGYGEAEELSMDSREPDGFAVAVLDTSTCDRVADFLVGNPQWSQLYGAGESAESGRLASDCLFVLRNLPGALQESIADAGREAGIQFHFVPEKNSILDRELIEVVSLTMDGGGIVFKTPFGSRRLPWDEISLLSLAKVRLTISSRSPHRLLLEVVGRNSNWCRFQVFERTATTKGSSVDGRTFDSVESLLDAAWHFAEERTSAARTLPTEPDHGWNVYDSYASYNDSILRALISESRKPRD